MAPLRTPPPAAPATMATYDRRAAVRQALANWSAAACDPASVAPRLPPYGPLPAASLDAAISCDGCDYGRLQRLGKQLAGGCALHVATLGGSSTSGHGFEREHPALYRRNA